MRFLSLLSVRRVAALCALSASLLMFPAVSSAKCPGVHKGDRYLGWGKPLRSNNWPYYQKDRGVIRVRDAAGNDQVYVNGCHVGKAANLDRFWIDPGRYNIAVTRHGRTVMNQRVSVRNGEAITLRLGNGR